jgi:hypothetical protein
MSYECMLLDLRARMALNTCSMNASFCNQTLCCYCQAVNEAQLLRLHSKFKSIADSKELLLLSTLCCQPEVVLVPFFSIYAKLFMQQLQLSFADPHVSFVAFAQLLSAFFILAPLQHKRTGERGSAYLMCIQCIVFTK